MGVKVLELRGLKSYWALNAFHVLLLGLKMLPSYLGESYEAFFQRVQEMSPADQEKMIREAAIFVKLDKEEMDSLLAFCLDPNGVPYTAENIKNLSPDQFFECIVAVCVEISKIKINLVTESEKKN